MSYYDIFLYVVVLFQTRMLIHNYSIKSNTNNNKHNSKLQLKRNNMNVVRDIKLHVETCYCDTFTCLVGVVEYVNIMCSNLHNQIKNHNS